MGIDGMAIYIYNILLLPLWDSLVCNNNNGAADAAAAHREYIMLCT